MVLPDDARWAHRSRVANGIQQHYVRQGRGPAVVLLHGWPGFWYDWRRLIPAVAEFADVIAPDFRGFGQTALPAGDPLAVSGQQNLSDDIVALLDALDVASAVFVGYDIGAAIAQHIARTRPDRVGALVLLNPTHPGIGDRRILVELSGEFWYQHLHRLPWAADLVASSRDTVETYLRHFYEHWTVRHEALTPAEFGAIVDTYARDGAFGASIAWYRARFAERAWQGAYRNPRSSCTSAPASCGRMGIRCRRRTGPRTFRRHSPRWNWPGLPARDISSPGKNRTRSSPQSGEC